MFRVTIKEDRQMTLLITNVVAGMIYLRSHLDKYLAVDSFGNVTCESEEKEAGSKFQIRYVLAIYGDNMDEELNRVVWPVGHDIFCICARI